MKKRVISVLALIALVAFATLSTTVKATEKGLWFVFTSFGEIETVELVNEDTGVTITLKREDLYDFETSEKIETVNPGVKEQKVKIKLPIDAKIGYIIRRVK